MFGFPGNETLSNTLRFLTSRELSTHADFYVDHSRVKKALETSTKIDANASSWKENFKWLVLSNDNSSCDVAAIKREAMDTLKDGRYCSLIHMMALSSVLKMKIFSVYPNRNMLIRPLFHGLIEPRVTDHDSTMYIMWSCLGGHERQSGSIYQPNHFVPVLVYPTTKDNSTEFIDTDDEITITDFELLCADNEGVKESVVDVKGTGKDAGSKTKKSSGKGEDHSGSKVEKNTEKDEEDGGSEEKESPGKDEEDGASEEKKSTDKDEEGGGTEEKKNSGKDEEDGGSEEKKSPGKDVEDGGSEEKKSPGKDEEDGASEEKKSPDQDEDGGGTEEKKSLGKDEEDGGSEEKKSPGKGEEDCGSKVKKSPGKDEEDNESRAKKMRSVKRRRGKGEGDGNEVNKGTGMDEEDNGNTGDSKGRRNDKSTDDVSNKGKADHSFMSDDNIPLSKYMLTKKRKKKSKKQKVSDGSDISGVSELESSDDENDIKERKKVKQEMASKRSKKKRRQRRKEEEIAEKKKCFESHLVNSSDSSANELESDEEDNICLKQLLVDLESDSDKESSASEEDAEDSEYAFKIPKWTKNTTHQRFEPFCGPPPGGVHKVPEGAKELQYFHIIFPQDMYETIATNSNRYVPIFAEKMRQQRQLPKWRDKHYETITAADIRAYLGIRMIMGIDKKPSIEDYWSLDPALGNMKISSTMSRRRFLMIQRYLQTSDPKEDKGYKGKSRAAKNKDPLAKVKQLMETVRANSRNSYNLHRPASVDEAMIKFHGKHWGVVGAPNKPAKRGFKIFVLADGISNFMKDFQIYLRSQRQEGLTQAVVENLTEDIQGFYHLVVVDKFYTSVPLAMSLLASKIYLSGSFNISRKYWPAEMKPDKTKRKKDDPVRNLTHGQCLFRQSDDRKLVATVWKDSALVYNLSTVHNAEINKRKDMVLRSIRDDKTGEWVTHNVSCPPSIIDFNLYMGGVDGNDHLRSSYTLQRPARKWWFYFMWFAIDMSLINSYILFKEKRPNASHKRFQLEVKCLV